MSPLRLISLFVGLLLVLTGVALRLRSGIDMGMIGLIAVFQLVTVPVSAHMVARAAHRTSQIEDEPTEV